MPGNGSFWSGAGQLPSIGSFNGRMTRRALNAAIAAQASSQLKAYPIPSGSSGPKGGTAVMGTPRNRDVSVARDQVHRKVNVMNGDDAALIAAQRNWRRCSPRARNIVAGATGRDHGSVGKSTASGSSGACHAGGSVPARAAPGRTAIVGKLRTGWKSPAVASRPHAFG